MEVCVCAFVCECVCVCACGYVFAVYVKRGAESLAQPSFREFSQKVQSYNRSKGERDGY